MAKSSKTPEESVSEEVGAVATPDVAPRVLATVRARAIVFKPHWATEGLVKDASKPDDGGLSALVASTPNRFLRGTKLSFDASLEKEVNDLKSKGLLR